MQTYFIDTWLWIALVDETRSEFAIAEKITDEIFAGTQALYTSEMVFTEFLAWCSGRGTQLREIAVEMIEGIRAEPRVIVVAQTHLQFQRSFERYKQFKDKEWSLTDCASMIAMADHNATCAITNDKHFTQAMFTIRNS